jgi:hypothetical protein
MLNAPLTLPLTPGRYEIRTPSRIVRLTEKFLDTEAKDPITGQPAPKERWRGTLLNPDQTTDSLKIYEDDGHYVAMNGVNSGFDLIRRIGD